MLPLMFIFMRTDKKTTALPLMIFFMTADKKRQCYPLCFFFMTTDKNNFFFPSPGSGLCWSFTKLYMSHACMQWNVKALTLNRRGHCRDGHWCSWWPVGRSSVKPLYSCCVAAKESECSRLNRPFIGWWGSLMIPQARILHLQDI